MSDRTEYKCEHCNKQYSSYKSRWLHIKKYHSFKDNPKVIQSNPKNLKSNPKVIQKSSKIIQNINEKDSRFKCNYCNKSFKYKQGKWKHEQKCKTKDNNQVDNNQIKKLEDQITELKTLLLKSMKIHPKTLQKINKQLIKNDINNGIINNNTINIVPIGDENLSKILSDKEKLCILNKKYNSVNELINKVHILPDDKYKKFKNAYITNLQNDIAYEYDLKNKQFIAVDKNDLLEKLIDKRMIDIETFALELDEKNDLPPELSTIIDKFVEQMWQDDSELKQKKIKQVKLLLYNSKNTIREQIKDKLLEIEL